MESLRSLYEKVSCTLLRKKIIIRVALTAEERSRQPRRRPLEMKRFFQPVPKDGSPAKKRPTGATDSGNAPAAAGAGGEEGSPGEEPRKFLTWNANSLLLRMKSDWPAFSQFVARLDPDVICIQVSDLGFRFGGSSFVCGLICNAARSSERSVCGGGVPAGACMLQCRQPKSRGFSQPSRRAGWGCACTIWCPFISLEISMIFMADQDFRCYLRPHGG